MKPLFCNLSFKINSTAFLLSLATILSAVWAPSAFAQRAVSLSADDKGSYARLVAKWSDGDEVAPKLKASIQSRVLVLEFDEAVSLNLQPVTENLPSWVALARLDADGKTARIALRKQDTKLHLSKSIDLQAVDILPETASTEPADIVSPLVAARQAAAVAAKVAEIPPPVKFVDGLEVRVSDGGDRTRVAFYWPEKVEFKADFADGVYGLKFNRRAKPDIARLNIEPPEQLEGARFVNDDLGMLFNLSVASGSTPSAYQEGNVVVVDLASKAAIEAAKREKQKQEQALLDAQKAAERKANDAENAVQQIKVADVPEETTPPIVNAKTESKPVELALPQVQASPKEAVFGSSSEAMGLSRDIGAEKKSSVEDQAKTYISEESQKRKEALNKNLGPRDTFFRGDWADPAPVSKVVKAQIKALPNGLTISVPWQAPAPAAVFSRPPADWIVFAVDADIEFDTSQVPSRYNIETIRQPDAVLMRVEAPDGMVASATSSGTTWTITFAPAALQPERFLKPVREVSETGRFSIETPLIGAAGVVWFVDPVVGDEIAAAVAFGPTSASTTARKFVEAEMPSTAHGLAIIPNADDVSVKLLDERVVVTSSRGMAMSDASGGIVSAYAKMKSDTPTPAFIDFDAWGGLAGNAFFSRKSELARAAAARDPASKAGADVLVDLARFYIGHDFGAEAVGVLESAMDGRPLLEQEAAFLGLRGAALVMMKRYELAEKDLSKGPLRADKSAQLWRGYVSAKMGRWERANDFFRQSEELIFAYSGRWAAEFYNVAAEAALKNNELDRARQLAGRAAGTSYREPSEAASLLLAQIDEAVGDTEKAYKQYVALTVDASEPVAVRAELHRLDLGAKIDKITPSEAADHLDTLRYRWRGDATEMATVGILADQYMSLGRFREALMLTQSAALRSPDEPGARELRIRLVDFFRRLYLDGEAERLDPIQALALYYEFIDLTPIGQDGDRMTRKLAKRLVAFDLLDPATELLQHQVDSRVRGQGKAVIAVDLATIYLMDKQPDRALAAIAASRQPRLPKELALQRRLLEAAAYRDMDRTDHAIELLENVEGLEAASIRADAYWKSEKWAEAAGQLASMLPAPERADKSHAGLALKTAIAGRLAKNMGLLDRLNKGYAPLFENSSNEQSFALITSQTDISGAALSEAVSRRADAPRVDAFAASLKQRFDGEG